MKHPMKGIPVPKKREIDRSSLFEEEESNLNHETIEGRCKE